MRTAKQKQHERTYEAKCAQRLAEQGLSSKRKPFTRGPYKTSRVAKPAAPAVQNRVPVEALQARAALAIERQEAARELAAQRKADAEAAARAHEANPHVQICRLERARKTERDNALIEQAKVAYQRSLADVPSYRRGRPRKNTGAAA